jgi:sarcosine oxidase
MVGNKEDSESQPVVVDTLVIGGGMAGTSAAYYLSQHSQLKIVLLERSHVGHAESSSFGEERMYRRMYSSEYLSDLQEKSLQEWRKLESQHHCTLLRENGLLFYGEVWGEETIEGSLLEAKKVMEKKKIPFEELDADAMQSRWPVQPRQDFIGLYEKTAGMVWAKRALQLFRHQAAARGVSIYEGEAVESLQATEAGRMEVGTSTGRCLKASKVILAVGAWTNDLLSGFARPLALDIWSMLWGYYRVQAQYQAQFPQWFCFQRANPETGDGGLYYGFPCHTPDTHLIKVGIDWCPEELRTRRMKDFKRQPNRKLAEFLDRFVHSHWRGICECVSLHCCPYTMTRDTLFVLDRLPGFPNVVVFTGGSGQAFKFAPLLGKLLAELALGDKPSVDITPLSAKRYEG